MIPCEAVFVAAGFFDVNDRKNPLYQQETPKARVLAFLDDRIAELEKA